MHDDDRAQLVVRGAETAPLTTVALLESERGAQPEADGQGERIAEAVTREPLKAGAEAIKVSG
jgi:hypothetical protein